MARLELKLQRTSPKNGMSAYKADNSRKSGTVYVDAKMFGGNHPEVLVVEGPDTIVDATPAVEETPAEATPEPVEA